MSVGDIVVQRNALRYAVDCNDPEAIDYVCDRLFDSTPKITRALCSWLRKDIESYLSKNNHVCLEWQSVKRLLARLAIKEQNNV